ncbi:MAG: glucosidase [Gallionellales bacterium RIFCSPLOWO2_12_FULL_59_22]|nr:MAG: glucosidase [Gallionellales bacterium RIFCSPLOWO2_02_FULL_59_110]OGT11400.1 MAG: glucosidase [Gallionellales bacterium RIFCSPLOWO2_12_FULL_59_22]
MKTNTAEHRRYQELQSGLSPWQLWGPYLSERQWGTVREDYSADGKAWDYFPHDHARSRAYRWGEDGLAGVSDHQQRLCLALALWNGKDHILKERLFGLSNGEGNHGEDVKELYYYLDATPTHSYLKFLYKYPHAEYPYARLLEESRQRGSGQPEFELPDSGVFDADRYFDVTVEYAKADPRDLLMRVTIANRGSGAAALHVLPQLWFRNTWSWNGSKERPHIESDGEGKALVHHHQLGDYHWYAEGAPPLLFTENDSNTRSLYGTDVQGYFKDAFHEFVVAGRQDAVSPLGRGSKAAAHYTLDIPGGESRVLRLRLSREILPAPFADFDNTFTKRIKEADHYYDAIQEGIADADARLVQRQALAGMIWSKQFYHFDIPQWFKGDPAMPAPPPQRRHGRNAGWEHLNNADIISMPDKWEYPWYAAWDLAFQCIPLALVDPVFAKQQLVLLTREWYMHPDGQLPAYEWELGDVNPPVHAWATWEVYRMDREQNGGKGDLAFLERVFHKLMLNFTWWVNRKDAEGRNVFQGGFLGLDNIGVFDRSAPLPTGGHIDQADGTSWMAMYALNLMRIALELAQHNPVYEDIATKYFEHFLYIAAAMNNIGDRGIGLWDEEDKFFYDVLRAPDGEMMPLKVRSIVGLIPLCAVEVLEPELLDRLPGFKLRLSWFLKHNPEIAALVSRWDEPGRGERRLLSLLRGYRMKHLLRRMLDEAEFLSAHGVRALSRAHLDQPYVFSCAGMDMSVGYQPGESQTGMFGGNSNWRGPVWMPINYLLIDSLYRFHGYYGDDFTVEYPTGSGQKLSLREIADDLSRRLIGLFLRNGQGIRPALGNDEKRQNGPHFRDLLLFHECFHGDDGHGLGASHQTGWTGLVANLIRVGGEPGRSG